MQCFFLNVFNQSNSECLHSVAVFLNQLPHFLWHLFSVTFTSIYMLPLLLQFLILSALPTFSSLVFSVVVPFLFFTGPNEIFSPCILFCITIVAFYSQSWTMANLLIPWAPVYFSQFFFFNIFKEFRVKRCKINNFH